jgi:P-type Ca2+ transporter type 2A
VVEMTAAVKGALDAMLLRWSREAALRCIALACKALPPDHAALTHADEHQLVFLGIVGLHDPPRPAARAAVKACQDAGIRVIMLTGTPPHMHVPAMPCTL